MNMNSVRVFEYLRGDGYVLTHNIVSARTQQTLSYVFIFMQQDGKVATVTEKVLENKHEKAAEPDPCEG